MRLRRLVLAAFVAAFSVWPCITLGDEPASPPAVEAAEGTDAVQAVEPAEGEAGTQKPAAAEEGSKFIRLKRGAKRQPLSLDTAIVEYTSANPQHEGLKVALIGAVHIGEKAYYQALNEEFDKYEVVLYELVAPEGTRVPAGGGTTRSPVSALQGGMKQMLELEFQLEHVDYQKPHLLHADMSPDDFSRSMAERGESVWTMFFRMMGQSILQQSKGGGQTSDLDLLRALFDKNRALSLKRLMAQQFEDLEGSMLAFEGPEGSTIISERNKVALRVLSEQIAAGKKTIGIFYGAGHMPDMEERLLRDFQLQPAGQRWLAAWDLRGKRKPPAKRAAPQEQLSP